METLLRFKKILLRTTLVFGVLTACTTTQMTGTWENQENYRPLVDDVGVFVLLAQPEVRRMAEQELVEQLSQREVRVLPGSTFSHGGRESRTAVPWLALKSEGVRYALVVDKFKRDDLPNRLRAVETPEDYQTFYNYYANSDHQPTMREALTTAQHISVEINLYDIDNRQIVMSIISDTLKQDDRNENIHDFFVEILNHMTEKGYFKAKD